MNIDLRKAAKMAFKRLFPAKQKFLEKLLKMFEYIRTLNL